MKEENRHSISEELLFRHFSGELSHEEGKGITSWVEESEQNQIEYERVHMFYLDTKAMNSIGKVEYSYDTNMAWKKVKRQNQFKTEPDTGGGILQGFLRVAASVVIVIGLGWFAYNRLLSTDEVVLASAEENVSQQLSDGSEVTLNKNSQLIYSEEFIGDKRKVALVGEAYFDIAPNKEKPFVITSGAVEVSVLGTSFNVNAANEDSIVVSVDTGTVMMTTRDGQEKLEAGMIGIYHKDARKLTKIVSTMSTHNYWNTKILIFRGNTLTDVVRSIERLYETSISIDSLGLGDCRISVTFEDESLEHVLDIIAATLRLELTKQDGTYSLKGDVCNGE